jgi:hypothetical protein
MNENYKEDDRKVLIQAMYSEHRLFDAALLAITSGAVGLSVTTYTSLETVSCQCLILIAWISLLLSIMFQVVSHLYSIKAHREEIMILDANSKKSNQYFGHASFCNYFALGLFLQGCILFLGFIIVN